MATHTQGRAQSARPGAQSWLGRLFLAHPRSVGETYLEHASVAGRFGAAMIAGGFRCLIHAAIPGVQQRSASETVRHLHRELIERQKAGDVDPDYVI